MRISLLLLLQLLLLGCAVGDFKAHQWYQVQSRHFTLVSDASPQKSEMLARQLEQFRAIVNAVVGEEPAPEVSPTRIYLFDDWGTYFEYTRGNNMLGFTVPTLRAYYIVISPGVYNTDQRRIIFHEYVHYLLRHRRARFPAWYDEGFAEFLSDVRERNGAIYIGNVPRGGITGYAASWSLPTNAVLSRDYDASWPPIEVTRFYGESWAITHFLMTGHNAGFPDRRDELKRYLQLVDEGSDRKAAFQSAFTISVDDLTQTVKRYIKRRRMPGLVLAKADLKYDDSVQGQPLTPQAVATQLGELTLLAGAKKARIAESLFNFTLADQPTDSSARSGLAISLAHQLRFKEALQQAEQAVAADPNRAAGHLDLAKILFGLCEAGYDSANPQTCIGILESAKQHFERGIELNAGSLEGHAGIGMTLARLNEDLPKAIGHLTTVNEYAQWLPQLSFELGKLYFRSGQPDLARTNLNNAARWTKDHALKGEAQALLARLDASPTQESSLPQG